MMRVLWITHVYPRFAGDMLGGFLHRLAVELPPRGVCVDVLAPWSEGTPEEEIRDGVRIKRFRYPGDAGHPLAYSGEMHRKAATAPVQFLRFLQALAKASVASLDSVVPDLMHAHWWVPSGIVARRVAPEGRPLVISIHGTDARLASRFPVVRPVARWVFRGAARLLPVSTAIATQVRSDAGVCPVLTLPMPADIDVFGATGEPRAPEQPTFVLAARLTTQKRAIDAVRAIGLLRRGGLEARLVIAGDGPERQFLEAEARVLGIREQVDFRGVLSATDLADAFRTATAVLLPSEREGYGLSLVEAGLCGVPGIGARSGGIPDVIDDGSTGLLVPLRRPDALAAAMQQLADDPEAARRMGARARQLARERTAGPLADRLCGIYREALAERAG